MPKVTLLGAGSGFTEIFFADILSIEGMDHGTIGLIDIDAKRLAISVKLMNKLLEVLDKKHWKIEASTDRLDVLKGTDYLISTIEVTGVPCVRFDNDIPLEYGIDQCIGDTIGPGGIMKALRTLPPFLDILKDAKRLCPKALIMNYTNPMSIISLGATRVTDQPFVGLCHSVQGTAAQLAQRMGVEHKDLNYRCAGINHLAWYTELSHKGRDMYPVLRAAAQDKDIYEQDPIRFDMMKHFGYFVTEGSGHFSEYVPYYRKRKDLLKKYTRKRYLGESGFYSREWPGWRKTADKRRLAQSRGKQPLEPKRSWEYASDIVEAHFLGRNKTVYASVPNTGLIPNLPQTGVVEVAVHVDRTGFTPTYFGPLPEQCAALCRSNMAVFELVVDGIMRHDQEAIVHGFMLDPLSAAVCCPAEIREMGLKLFKAEKKYIPAWVQKPKKVRLASYKKDGKLVKAKQSLASVSDMAARGA